MQPAMEDGSAFVASIGGPLDDTLADHAPDGGLRSPEMKAVARVRRDRPGWGSRFRAMPSTGFPTPDNGRRVCDQLPAVQAISAVGSSAGRGERAGPVLLQTAQPCHAS
jgi:hypothetical protein